VTFLAVAGRSAPTVTFAMTADHNLIWISQPPSSLIRQPATLWAFGCESDEGIITRRGERCLFHERRQCQQPKSTAEVLA